MDKHDREFARLLDQSGARLIRKRRHAIYRLPSGGNIVCSATPSSWSASRKRVRDLRHIIRNQVNASAVPEKPEPHPSKSVSKHVRNIQQNWDARSEAEVRIPSLDRTPRGTDANRPFGQFSVKNISDLVDAAEMTDSWRHLDVFGRTRVLTRIASRVPQFAGVMVAAVRYAVTSEKELETLKGMPWFADGHRAISEAMQTAYSRVRLRSSDWQPALVIDDPESGRFLLEFDSNELLQVRDKIFAIELPAGSAYDYFVFTRNNTGNDQVARNHPWREDFIDDETERKLFYMVLLPTAATVFQVHLSASPKRSQAQVTTRQAIEDVLDTFQSISQYKRSSWKLRGPESTFSQVLVSIASIIIGSLNRFRGE